MKIHQAALYPFSVLYDGATRVRNSLFDFNIRESHAFWPVVINVGNLSVGGTGKTPMVEYLLRLLHNKFQVATLSRGYGRKTKGFRLAAATDDAHSLGDEPFQIYQAWKEQVVVAVGEKRAEAITRITAAHPAVEVILLDDAYQHRAVERDMDILLTTWERPFFKDYVLPAGRLRESRNGAKRADMVVVTKCPTIPGAELIKKYQEEIREYVRKEVPVFFSTLSYDLPQPFNELQSSIGKKVVLVSGLAKAAPFEEEACRHFTVIRHFQYPDHYAYKVADVKMLVEFVQAQPDCALLTTEKDAAKWRSPLLAPLLLDVPVFTLPVRHSFLRTGLMKNGEKRMEDKAVFESCIMDVINGKANKKKYDT